MSATMTALVTSNLTKPSLLAAASASPTSKADTKKLKAATVNASQMYGCSHIKVLMDKNRPNALNQYTITLKLCSKWRRIAARCSKCESSAPNVFYCLQCTDVSCLRDGSVHKKEGQQKHVFAVNSRSGHLYCYMCQDYIYDPGFEEVRLKYGTAVETQICSQLLLSKKRKFDEFRPTPEEARINDRETTNPTCKATGLRGIHNMGATCYISVIIQSMMQNPIVRNHYLAEGHNPSECKREKEREKDKPSNCMACVMNDLYMEFFGVDSTHPFIATKLLATSWRCGPALAGKEQHDASEYLIFLLGKLCESNRDESPASSESGGDCNCIIHRCFYGVMRIDKQCRNCDDIPPIRSTDIELGVQLPLKTHSTKKSAMEPQEVLTLEDLLKSHVSREKVMLDCQNCSTKAEFNSQTTFQELPNVLTVVLKRFEAVPNKEDKYRKNKAPVTFPAVLDMTPYTPYAKRKKGNIRQNDMFIYDLLTVIDHEGTLDSGHYISYSKAQDGSWYKFNDSTVTKATEKEVLEVNPYILFYMIRTIKE